MAGQISEFSHFYFLERLEEFVRGTLKSLEIVRTTIKRKPPFLTVDNLITALCSVYIQLHRSIASCLIDIKS